ncbi:type II secretion system protein GspM [Paludibacterium purpuratum]|uniref:Type II secretory pathway component PulM n=1 Tax=Paludibacterium purpuratum TaxID=1144873 RepID=A0A4R7AUR1_9NEIS|nr:type II secretion system protein GspM [Paludibacterium purpuratum]TDR70746.1 type II secretory pathway component PulM [Paludibacterium purpuratum]
MRMTVGQWRPAAAAVRRVGKPLGRVLCVLLLAALLLRLVWWPLWQAVEQARQAQLAQRVDADRMAALAKEWRALRSQPPVSVVPAARVSVLLTERANALGLDTDDWQLMQEAHGVRLRGEVGFDAWLALLADLQASHSVHVIDLQLEPASTGRVHVDAVFQGMGE